MGRAGRRIGRGAGWTLRRLGARCTWLGLTLLIVASEPKEGR